MEQRITITTTRERAEAFAAAMAHEHVSYTGDGQLVKGFLDDVEGALHVAEPVHTEDDILEARQIMGLDYRRQTPPHGDQLTGVGIQTAGSGFDR